MWIGLTSPEVDSPILALFGQHQVWIEAARRRYDVYMCGRYVEESEFIENYHQHLFDFMDAMEQAGVGSRYNIAPSQRSLIRRWEEDAARVAWATWGFIPSWEKNEKGGRKPINARNETAHSNGVFRNAFKKRRCLVLATGYYEWKKLPAGGKQPYYIHLEDHRPFFFYGLWESWSGPKEAPLETPRTTYTILTTESGQSVADIHDRMPCMIDVDREELETWLDPEFQGEDHLRGLLRPYDTEDLVATPVSEYVNNVRNQGPKCVTPCN